MKAGAQWIQYLLSLLPDCPWQHIVFTLPCQYWSLVFHNRWLLAEFLFGSNGTCITGSDLLIDGGATASYQYGELDLPIEGV